MSAIPATNNSVPMPEVAVQVAVPHPVTASIDSANTDLTSLYVGDLGEYVTEAHLFELFNLIGPVASIRVCRDSTTRRSLGYAYVNYRLPADAAKAIETLNHSLIQDKTCRVMYSQRNSSTRDEAGNVFIKNLDLSIDSKALQDTFSSFGKILSCKVVSENGVSKGYGFVQFESADDAENAIKSVNGMMLNDKVVYVARHESSKERQSKSDKALSTFTNIYVKGFGTEMSSKELEELFSKYGAITSALVELTPEGKSKGFGFINFETHDQAEAAIKGLHDKEYNGSKLYVARAQTKTERTQELTKDFQAAKEEKKLKYGGANVYFKNFEDNMAEEVRAAFNSKGTITSFKIMTDANGNSRGFGFACFSTPAEANQAIIELNSRMFGSKPLFVTLAQTKEERLAQLASQRAVHDPMAPYNPMYPGHAGFYPPVNGFVAPPPNMIYGQPGPMPPRPQWNDAHHLLPANYGPNGGRANHNMMPQQANRQPRSPRNNYDNSANRGNNRNAPSSVPAPYSQVPVPVAEPQIPAVSTSGLSAAALAAASLADQKQMLGEHLFPLIHAQNSEHAGKITGMLLEMENDELLYLIENADARQKKIDEALSVLKQHS